ncbi:DUF2523 domain-containing protein [Conchiformibius kuhniae]|uniref:DUF2523 domain-containing protein n=1 Tax=Conchiformibius kuhniae TaxID=211502 RepID=A0A8T9MUG0_9NEIS|nr:DUF2523 domain-containing protein [Conchiformibius kuhniae]UOP04475.1 DUF2523 domain-containing protein [Conchiformibius kuhniae]
MNILIKAFQSLLVWGISKLMLALGVSFVIYKGLDLSLDALKGYIQNSFSGVPADAYNLMLMAGLGQALGIIFGAFAFNAALAAGNKLAAGVLKK